MTDLLSKERLEKIASWRERYGADSNVMIPADDAEALVREVLQRREAAENPEYWFRQRTDGGREGPLHDSEIDDVRKTSGAWNPLFTTAPLTSAERESLAQQYRAEGVIFAANRMLAAWDAGFIDKPAADTLDVATMILSAVEMLKDATDGDFKRDFADEMLGFLRKEIKGEAKC
ncbi:hypothetical protein [Pectobacterium aroidearum]|uniref:hypothetical protein n=1 Tax=Pectobacterium aroidearum TaxID=1201031 RepID=UPI003019E485